MHDPIFYTLVLIGTFLAAGLVKGVTGMGLPTVAMGLLGTVMSPAAAAAVLLVPSLVTNMSQLFNGPSTVRLVRRLWPMMLCLALGTTGGAALLVAANPAWSGFGLGTALIVYAAYALMGPRLTVSRRAEKWLSPLVGGLTGIVTGATGVFVMPAVPYLGALSLSRDELVQALGLSFTVSTVALALGLFGNDAFEASQVGLSSLATVPALIGMWLGQRLRARISPTGFRLCFLVFLLLLGFELVCRPFF